MYYLYYNREKVILTKDRIQDGRHEMLEQNPVVEKLVQRSKVYTQSYRCEFEIVDKDIKIQPLVMTRILNPEKIREGKRRNPPTMHGINNPNYGKKKDPETKRKISETLKRYYKTNKHGKAGYKDSEETKRLKRENHHNRGKGRWFWICNVLEQKEKRCYNDNPIIEEGWKRGRLHDYLNVVSRKIPPNI